MTQGPEGPRCLRPGERWAVGGTELCVLAIAPDGRVTLRIGPAGRCERRVTLGPGGHATAGGLALEIGAGTTPERAEILLV